METKTDQQILVERALSGDLESLELLIAGLQHKIYNLALKFLWHPEDAEDATQEILIKVTLNLNRFEGRSALETWAYRIATNFLIDLKKSRARESELTFAMIERELRTGSKPPEFENEVETAMLAENVKSACTHAMLQCLNADQRIAFILGEAIGLNSSEAALVLSVTPETYRRRLSRARARMTEFLCSNCGLMDRKNSCRCPNRIDYARKTGRFEPYLEYGAKLKKQALHIPHFYQLELDRMERLGMIYKQDHPHPAPERLLLRMKRLFEADQSSG